MTSPSGPSSTTWVTPIAWSAAQLGERLALGDLAPSARGSTRGSGSARRRARVMRLIVCPMHGVPGGSTADERPHPGAAVDEWVFAAWTADGVARRACRAIGSIGPAGRWYWSALARAGQPLLHLAEWDVAVRPDPFVVKAPRRCGPSITATRRSSSGRSATRRTSRRSTTRPRRSVAATACRRRRRSISSGTPRRRRGSIAGTASSRRASCTGSIERGRAGRHRARRGAGATLAPVEPTRPALDPVELADGGRPHRAAGAVRLPRRDRRRLGAHPGRVGASSSSR